MGRGRHRQGFFTAGVMRANGAAAHILCDRGAEPFVDPRRGAQKPMSSAESQPLSDPRPRHKASVGILGTRGIPARYGGFETLAEEIGPRLAAAGHRVLIYGRPHAVGPLPDADEHGLREYRGTHVRLLGAPRTKYLETVLHTLASARDARGRGLEAVLLCNAANALAIPGLRRAGMRVVVNVDGIEWRRRKWGTAGRAWHRLGARLASRWASELIADARVMQELWEERFGRRAVFIPYGAPQAPVAGTDALERLRLQRRRYLLWVGRLEPENNPDLVVEAFRHVSTAMPLVIVGDAPHGARLRRRLQALAREDERVRLVGSVYGDGYAQLQSHAAAYVQASEIGGTHPALLEAMAYGGLVIVNDIPEHREVVGGCGLVYPFNDRRQLASRIEEALMSPRLGDELRERARRRVQGRYSWQRVASRYSQILAPVRPRARPPT